MHEHYYNELYYRTNEFKPDRLTLVIAHGLSGSSSAWIPYEKIFENKYNLVVYDIRGHGMSKKYSNYSDYETKNFAEDLHKLVTYLKLPKLILISNSFSGLIALEYLKSHRENVIGNIFTSPAVYIHRGLGAKISRTALLPITKVVSVLPFNPKPRGHVDYSKHQNTGDWNIKRNIADIRNTGLRAQFFTLKHSFAEGQEYELEKINVPTLIIHGDKDTMVPLKNAKLMSEKIKNAEFITLPSVNHNTAHNAVTAMSGAIENFIEKNKATFDKSSSLVQ